MKSPKSSLTMKPRQKSLTIKRANNLTKPKPRSLGLRMANISMRRAMYAYDLGAQEEKTNRAKDSANARHTLSRQVRQFAVFQYCKEIDIYSSPREAAGALAQDVLEYAVAIGAQDKKNFRDVFQVRDTVYKWLLAFRKNASAS